MTTSFHAVIESVTKNGSAHYLVKINTQGANGTAYVTKQSHKFDFRLCKNSKNHVDYTAANENGLEFPAGYSSYSYRLYYKETSIGDRTGYFLDEKGNQINTLGMSEDVTTNSGTLHVNGSVYFDVLYSYSGGVDGSDLRLKNNIEPLTNSYSLLFDKLNPVRYKLNNDSRDRYHTGFIAQDVLDALEKSDLAYDDFSAVEIMPYDNLYGLRYDEFIPLLVKEVQDLKNRMTQLENK